jgi:hypothetical protein|mmetsp:Transcript_56144/g.89047  ORF Transcript_56144/g.89047 Transcript_56144/m.89047 type:complete len:764 (-) Transcript_56144:109-2400(-)
MKRADHHAEERKVAVTSQMCSQTNAAYENYTELHNMQRADLDRAMATLGQSFDDEERRRAESSDELFQQEFVESDKQRGIEHLARIQKIVEKQESVYRNIMAKVIEAPPRVRKERTDPTDEARDTANQYRKREHAGIRVANSCVVANSMLRKQARYEKFHSNRLLIAIAGDERVASLKASHAEADRLAERRQHELVEKQFHKSLASQQKRNEQQKMLKELQRFQDHQFELLQLKHHPESVSTQKHLPPVAHPNAPRTAPSSGVGSSKSEPIMARTMGSEPIYRDMQQSHKLFASTLDRWRSFEADNEKRTEAYWRKMLQGERKKESEKKESKLGVLRRKVTEINTIRRFVQQAQHSLEGRDMDKMEVVETMDVSEEPLDSPLLSPSLGSALDASGRSLYSERLEKVRYFQEEKERLAFAKRQRDMKNLEDKVERSRQLQLERVAKAQESMRIWEEKSTASSMKRDKDSRRSDGDLQAKMEMKQHLLEEKKAKENEEREQYFAAQTQAKQNIREAAKANRAETKRNLQERQAKENELAQSRLEERMKLNEKGGHSSTQEIARDRSEWKKEQDSQLSASIQKEIAEKSSRHEKALKQVAKPTTTREAIQRHRQLQKGRADQCRRASASELALPPELSLPAHLFLQSPSNNRRRLTTELIDAAESPSSDVQAHSADSGSPKVMRDSRTRRSFGLLSVSGGSGSAGLSSPAVRHGPSPTGGSSHRSTQFSQSDDESSDEEGNTFMQDLQMQSSKWLQDARKKADVLG